MSKLSLDFYLIPISDPGARLTAETNAWRQPTQAMASIGIAVYCRSLIYTAQPRSPDHLIIPSQLLSLENKSNE